MEMEPVIERRPVGHFGIIHLHLLPGVHTEQQRSEVNDLFRCLFLLCSEEERTKDTRCTVAHIATLHKYYNESAEVRAKIDAEIERQGLDRGVDNVLRIVYRDTKQQGPMPQVAPDASPLEQAQQDEAVVKRVIEGGTPAYEDIIGFLSYYASGVATTTTTIHIGHVFINEFYRRQHVATVVMRNLITGFLNPDSASPLFIADVPSTSQAALKLFLHAGFFFVRQRRGGGEEEEEAEEDNGGTTTTRHITREEA